MGSLRKSHLDRYKQDRLVEHFVAGTAASLCGVNRKTSTLYFLRLRKIITYEHEAKGKPRIDLTDLRTNQVWRFEMRLGSKQLLNRFERRSWQDVRDTVGGVFADFRCRREVSGVSLPPK